MCHPPEQSKKLLTVRLATGFDVIYPIVVGRKVYGLFIAELVKLLMSNIWGSDVDLYHVKGNWVVHPLVLRRHKSDGVSWKRVFIIDRIVWTMPL